MEAEGDGSGSGGWVACQRATRWWGGHCPSVCSFLYRISLPLMKSRNCAYEDRGLRFCSLCYLHSGSYLFFFLGVIFPCLRHRHPLLCLSSPWAITVGLFTSHGLCGQLPSTLEVSSKCLVILDCPFICRLWHWSWPEVCISWLGL